MKVFDTLREHMNQAKVQRATRKLDNHLRRDIGLPEVHDFPTLPNFRV